jgi:predicted RNA-binding Zn-ribbon protein involved in translation (DUF1610 family)
MNHRPVCISCNVELYPRKNDVVIEDMASFGSYQLWNADIFKCPLCGIEIATGFGYAPFAECYQEDYEKRRKSASERNIHKSFKSMLEKNNFEFSNVLKEKEKEKNGKE